MTDEVLTTTSDVDPAVSTYYDRVLLERALPELIYTMFGDRRPLPSNNGNTVKWRRYTSLTKQTAPLVEGVTPPGEKLSKTDITAQISWYGHFVSVTDQVDLTVEDATLTEATELIGENYGQSFDEVVRDILAACATVQNCSGGTNSDTPTEVTRGDINTAVQTLKGNNAKMLNEVVTATEGVGTSPIRKAFWCLADTDMLTDLEDVAGFMPTSEYPKQDTVLEAEWGATGNLRWMLSSEGYVGSSESSLSADVYYNIVIARNSYGITELSEATMKAIIKGFEYGGPLNQWATVGWKNAFVSRILNDNFMLNLKATLAT